MQFVLTGFTHDKGFRVFTFDRIGEDRVRTKCTVRADLSLIRNYGIHIQELPLLCRGLLDRSDESSLRCRGFGSSPRIRCRPVPPNAPPPATTLPASAARRTNPPAKTSAPPGAASTLRNRIGLE